MSDAGARRLAWSLWALAVAMIAGQLVFAILNGGTGASDADSLDYALTVPVLVLPTIGALVASRRPRHPVGWILTGSGVVLALSTLAEGYGIHALFTDPGGLPAGEVAAGIAATVFILPLFVMPVLLFLIFPDGHLPSPRWRVVVWLGGIAAAAVGLGGGVFAETLDDPPFEGVANGIYLEVPEPVAAACGWVGWPGVVLTVVLAATGMIRRLRRSHGQQRQQLKWMAAAAGLFAVTTFVSVVSYFAGAPALGGVVLVLGYAAIPMAAGAAILRHRIYDIDLVINRALVYGALTAILVGAYIGAVLLLGLVLAPLTSGSDLAIAFSTLAVAALVRPARRRVQAVVDRRFFRRRYDAERTLERFGARLRTETDLDALRAELTDVVREAMQPAHVSLWLRGPAQ